MTVDVVKIPDFTRTTVAPGCECQPVVPPGAKVMCVTTTSVPTGAEIRCRRAMVACARTSRVWSTGGVAIAASAQRPAANATTTILRRRRQSAILNFVRDRDVTPA